MLHGIIMAGGSGTRLWPESRAERPKQLLTIGAEVPLIRQSVRRLQPLIPPERIHIAANDRFGPALLEAAEELPHSALITEPCPRNTTGCIALAAVECLRTDPDATMAVITSDHIITPESEFQRCLAAAVQLVEREPDRLVTFGCRPTYPAESFGYIQRRKLLGGVDGTDRADRTNETDTTDGVNIYQVERFREKPDRVTAEEYLRTGLYYWNSGMFVWKAQTILDNLHRFVPDIYESFMRIADDPQASVIKTEFQQLRSISIDYAVMEHSDRVAVVEATFDWDDVGSWGSLSRLLPPDEQGNTLDCTRFVSVNSDHIIARCANPNHLIAVSGIHDVAIIVSGNVTLVINRADEESVRELVAQVRANGWEEYL